MQDFSDQSNTDSATFTTSSYTSLPSPALAETRIPLMVLTINLASVLASLGLVISPVSCPILIAW